MSFRTAQVGKVKTVLLDLGLIRTSTPLSSPSREHLVSLRSYVQGCLCIVLRPFAAGLILQRQLGEWVASAFVVAEAGWVLSSAAEA
jgi:hypothetical protein